MSKKEILSFNYKIQTTKDDEFIVGQLFYPIIDGKIFKPIKATIYDAELTDAHRANLGVSSKESRDAKDKFIKNYFDLKLIGRYGLHTPFSVEEPAIGIVKFAGDLLGYHTNKNINFVFFDSGTSLDGVVVPRKLSGLSKSTEVFTGNEKHIGLEEALKRKVI